MIKNPLQKLTLLERSRIEAIRGAQLRLSKSCDTNLIALLLELGYLTSTVHVAIAKLLLSNIDDLTTHPINLTAHPLGTDQTKFTMHLEKCVASILVKKQEFEGLIIRKIKCLTEMQNILGVDEKQIYSEVEKYLKDTADRKIVAWLFANIDKLEDIIFDQSKEIILFLHRLSEQDLRNLNLLSKFQESQRKQDDEQLVELIQTELYPSQEDDEDDDERLIELIHTELYPSHKEVEAAVEATVKAAAEAEAVDNAIVFSQQEKILSRVQSTDEATPEGGALLRDIQTKLKSKGIYTDKDYESFLMAFLGYRPKDSLASYVNETLDEQDDTQKEIIARFEIIIDKLYDFLKKGEKLHLAQGVLKWKNIDESLIEKFIENSTVISPDNYNELILLIDALSEAFPEFDFNEADMIEQNTYSPVPSPNHTITHK